MEDKKKHSMQTTAQRTGLSPHVIRVWEKRYQAVSPERTGTNRRFYSDLEVERLQLLKRLRDAKYRISQVAHLPLEELRKVAGAVEVPSLPGAPPLGFSPEIFNRCMAAVERLDTRKLEIYIGRASLSLSPLFFMEKFIAPLLREISRKEREGLLREVQVQAAWLVIRRFLVNLANIFDVPDNAPPLMVAAPSGQYLESGSLFILTGAAAVGWRGIYLGVNLPAEEIAAGAGMVGAKMVALSLSSARDDYTLERELQRLAYLLPKEIPLVVFGENLAGLTPLLAKIGATQVADLAALNHKLNELFPEIL